MSNSLYELEIYREAMRLGGVGWDRVVKWDYFGKNTVGNQFISSADSGVANDSEWQSRFRFKENQKFCDYSSDYLIAGQTWLEKAARRKFIDGDQGSDICRDLEILKKRFNAYIRSIGPKLEKS